MKNAIYTFKFAGLLSAFALRATAIEAPPEAPPEAPQQEPKAQVEQMPFQQENAVAASAYLGLGTARVPEVLGVHLGLKEGEGILIRALDPEGPATKAGFTIHDVITKIDEFSVGSHADMTKRILKKKPGDEVAIDYIHEGKLGCRKVILGKRADSANAMGDGAERPLDRLLECMPQDQAKKIRESIERSITGACDLQDMFQLQGQAAAPEMDKAMMEMQKRVEKMLGGVGRIGDIAGAAGGGANQMNFQSESTIKLLDDKGSVELKSKDGGKEVHVLDQDGKETWTGPWDSEQDKAAAPADVRDRIERLNIDMDFKGKGLRLRIQPQGLPVIPDE